MTNDKHASNDPRLSATDIEDNEALAEGLSQIQAIDADEEDRRKTVDAKIGNAQNALGFTVTLASGSLAYALLQGQHYDPWSILALLSLVVSVVFFLLAALTITKANGPEYYQMRKPDGVRRMLKQHCTRCDIQADAINDLVSNVDANSKITDKRLDLYIASITKVRIAIIALACVPAIILLGIVAKAVGSHCFP